MVRDLAKLFVRDVEVVDEPLLGGRDLTFLPDRMEDVSVGGQKYASVLPNPGEKGPSFVGLPGGAMRRGQALGVLLQALNAEELSTDRLFHLRRSGDDGIAGVHFDLSFRDFGSASKVQLACIELRTANVPVSKQPVA